VFRCCCFENAILLNLRLKSKIDFMIAKRILIILVAALMSAGGSMAANWKLFHNARGKFEVQFPGDHTDKQKPKNGTKYGNLNLNIFTCTETKPHDRVNVFMVMYNDYPPTLMNSGMDRAIIDNHFNESIDEAVSNSQGKLTAMKNVQLEGYPGRSIMCDIDKGTRTIVMNIYLVKNRAYMVVVSTNKNANEQVAIDRFFKSFRLLKG
jgi:hypothetical protein